MSGSSLGLIPASLVGLAGVVLSLCSFLSVPTRDVPREGYSVTLVPPEGCKITRRNLIFLISPTSFQVDAQKASTIEQAMALLRDPQRNPIYVYPESLDVPWRVVERVMRLLVESGFPDVNLVIYGWGQGA
jgi:hypothetical protein